MAKAEEAPHEQQQPPSLVTTLLFHSKLDDQTKLKTRLALNTGRFSGMLVGVICVCILDFIIACSGYAPGLPTRTPPMDFHIHSFNLSSSSPKTNLSVVLSVQNPLPFALHVYLARASVSHTHHLLGTGFMHSFRVLTMSPDRVMMVSADLSSSLVDAAGLGGGAVAGFEFQVDGLVKILEGSSKQQRMRSMKVVCGDLEVWFSSDFTAARLVGGPNKCVQSWGGIY